jgi:hypothetical protein
MVGIAKNRLEPWSDRADVLRTSGEVRLLGEAGSVDRVVANYVLDLMSEGDIRTFIREARRALGPGGLLCVASLTNGATRAARVVARLWAAVQALKPAWTGGCRPISVKDYLEPDLWRIHYHEVVTQCAVSSEVLVAGPEHDSQ